jgi:hypothetical protein
MKNKGNDLFKKFEDEKINKNSLTLIEGGANGPGSDSTGDTDCTTREGGDCTDIYTDGIFDTDPTNATDDTCRR